MIATNLWGISYLALVDNAALKKFGLNVVRIRDEKGISQVELANRCDFERGNMTRIEKGNTNVTLLTILKIAKALDVPAYRLLEKIEE